MIKPGKYKARAVDADFGYAETGADQVAVLFQILEGPHTGEELTWFGFFTEKTREITKKALVVCGCDGDRFPDPAGISKNEVEIVVEVESDQRGVSRERVRWVNRVGGLRLKHRMSDEQRRAFMERLRKEIAAAENGNSATSVSEQDETPF